jgi:transcriptional regulator with XRE-family HTH domain
MEHGALQLAEWIERKGLSQTAAAEKLGIHKATLNKILKRTRLPGRQNATVIRDMAGIPLDAWVPTRVAKRRSVIATKARKSQYWQGVNA